MMASWRNFAFISPTNLSFHFSNMTYLWAASWASSTSLSCFLLLVLQEVAVSSTRLNIRSGDTSVLGVTRGNTINILSNMIHEFAQLACTDYAGKREVEEYADWHDPHNVPPFLIILENLALYFSFHWLHFLPFLVMSLCQAGHWAVSPAMMVFPCPAADCSSAGAIHSRRMNTETPGPRPRHWDH